MVRWSKWQHSLQELWLDYNVIEKLPLSICSLQGLQLLSLIYNKIQDIPDQIVAMKSLRTLNLFWNELQTLNCGAILFNNHMKALDLGNNENFGNMFLQTLKPHEKQSKSMHNNCSAKPDHQNLATQRRESDDRDHVQNEQEHEIRNEVLSFQHKPQLSGLTILQIHSIDLIEFPSQLCVLTHLEILDLHDNQIKALPECLGEHLEMLRSFNVSENKLASLPSSLGKLKQLQFLDASNNMLDVIPDSFATSLSSLQKLILNDNRISQLPEQLPFSNKYLLLLELRRNPIPNLPQSWQQIPPRLQQSEDQTLYNFQMISHTVTSFSVQTQAGSSSSSQKIEIFTSLPDEIIPGLYIGSVESISDPNVLKIRNIQSIVRVLKQPLPLTANKSFDYFCIPVIDDESENISSYFDSSFSFIDSALSSNKSVLVHCSAGVSRSATIVIAYLMRKYKYSLHESIRKVRLKRHICKPNPSFLRQLKQLEIELNK